MARRGSASEGDQEGGGRCGIGTFLGNYNGSGVPAAQRDAATDIPLDLADIHDVDACLGGQ